MSTNLVKSARIVAVVALACVSPYSESKVHGGGNGNGSFGLPTKGTCGFALTLTYPFTYLFGNNPGPGWGVDALGTIDFQTSTLEVTITLMNPTPLPSQQYPFTFSAPFTVAQGPIANSATITFDFPNNGGTFGFNLLPVNGGKTFLMQQFTPPTGHQGDGGTTGRCEM